MLSPQGHVEHHSVVTELGGTVYLDTEPGAGAALLGYLDGMRFWSKVEVADVDRASPMLTLLGPRAGSAEQVLGRHRSGYRARGACPDGGFTRRTDDGIDLLVPRAELRPGRPPC